VTDVVVEEIAPWQRCSAETGHPTVPTSLVADRYDATLRRCAPSHRLRRKLMSASEILPPNLSLTIR
jgi:hypothetical protein